MQKILSEITQIVDGKLKGDGNLVISGVGDIESAEQGQITFIKDKKYLEQAKKSNASAIIIPPGIEGLTIPTIEVANPYLSFNKILNIIYGEKKSFYKGIHKTVILGNNTRLGKNVCIGPYSVIGDDVIINDNTIICSQVFIGDRTSIGTKTLIYPNVSVREDTILGNNVIIHCGTVIGGDGCGFLRDGEKYIKIPQVGRVIVEDDVEIGANVAIDRATIKSTVIGKGTKIDNLVHIAHNVNIGENSILLAHVTIAGSTKIGKHAIFSGQSGALDNLKVGDNVIAASRAGIVNDIPDNTTVWGFPAIPIKEQQKITVLLRKLPELTREVKELKNKIELLETESGKKADTQKKE